MGKGANVALWSCQDGVESADEPGPAEDLTDLLQQTLRSMREAGDAEEAEEQIPIVAQVAGFDKLEGGPARIPLSHNTGCYPMWSVKRHARSSSSPFHFLSGIHQHSWKCSSGSAQVGAAVHLPAPVNRPPQEPKQRRSARVVAGGSVGPELCGRRRWQALVKHERIYDPRKLLGKPPKIKRWV